MPGTDAYGGPESGPRLSPTPKMLDLAESTGQATVFVIDNEPAVRQMLQSALKGEGFEVVCHGTASSFLATLDPSCAGCLVVDVHLPGMSGLDLLDQLRAQGSPIPMILMSGHATIPIATGAMRSGAFEFLEKPIDLPALMESVRQALGHYRTIRRKRLRAAAILSCAAALTPRERQVMDLIILGYSNKQVASKLFISHKTVELHRSRVMQKMEANSLAGLIHSVYIGGLYKPLG